MLQKSHLILPAPVEKNAGTDGWPRQSRHRFNRADGVVEQMPGYGVSLSTTVGGINVEVSLWNSGVCRIRRRGYGRGPASERAAARGRTDWQGPDRQAPLWQGASRRAVLIRMKYPKWPGPRF